MRHRDGSVDRLIAEIASSSQGVVARRTLLANGVSPAQLRSRLKRGSLIAVHPGIYRVGHQAPSVEASYLAAVLAWRWGSLGCSPRRPSVGTDQRNAATTRGDRARETSTRWSDHASSPAPLRTGRGQTPRNPGNGRPADARRSRLRSQRAPLGSG